jgi:hypothetical protein
MDRGDRVAPGIDLLAAVREQPVAFLAPIVVLALVLAAYGMVRSPRYTADAQISVGRLDIPTQGLPGFAQAGASMAAAFSRAIDAPPVTRRAAARAHVSRAVATDALSAAPIPQSPLIRVEATASDARLAVRLANGGTRGLIDYSRRVGAGNTDNGLLTRYTALSRQVTALAVQRAQAEARARQSPTAARRSALAAVDSRYRALVLQRDAVGTAYGARAAGQSAASLLSVLAPATVASSDRTTVVKRLGVTGAIAGLVVGLALAAWRAGRPRRRATPLKAAA